MTLIGRLTRDPELRHTNGGTAVCSLRLAVNSRARDESGEWGDAAGFFDVTVFGRLAESAAEHLEKGRQVAVDGRLSWREWTDRDGGKRQAVEVVANDVQYLARPGHGTQQGPTAAKSNDIPATKTQTLPGTGGGSRRTTDPDSADIPFQASHA